MLESSQLGGRGCNVHLHILYRKGLWDMFLKYRSTSMVTLCECDKGYIKSFVYPLHLVLIPKRKPHSLFNLLSNTMQIFAQLCTKKQHTLDDIYF